MQPGSKPTVRAEIESDCENGVKQFSGSSGGLSNQHQRQVTLREMSMFSADAARQTNSRRSSL